MSILDKGIPGLCLERPVNPDDAEIWDELADGVFKYVAMVDCDDNNTCRGCRRRYELSSYCPVCGSKAPDDITGGTVFKCQCGVSLVSCNSNGSTVCCGVAIPVVRETEDVI